MEHSEIRDRSPRCASLHAGYEKAPDWSAFFASSSKRLFRSPDSLRRRRLVGLQLGTRFGGTLLQLVLQLLLGFLKDLRIGRRTVIGLGDSASGSGSVNGAPFELIAWTTRFCPF